MRRSHRLLGGLAVAALCALPPVAADAKPKQDVDVQLLGINDFHGQFEPLDPTRTSSGYIVEVANGPRVTAGGAAYLATHLEQLQATNKRSMIVSAGDLIGASPLVSAIFHDEPTIEAFNEMGLALNAVGNHEFDEGVDELLRMQNGGCHPVDGCFDGPDEDTEADGFAGADFRFLAANVVRKSDGKPIFPAYAIRTFKGIKVGFIGMTLEGTPNIVTPSGIQSVDFLDEAETANKYANILRYKKGVQAIVVLLHEGGTPSPFASIDGCNLTDASPIVPIVKNTTKDVDLFITGHTHQPYVCAGANAIDGRAVTSASSLGRLITDIDVTLDARTRDFVKPILADNKIVTRDVAPDPAVQRIFDAYTQISAPLAARVIGNLTGAISRTLDPDGSREQTAGNLIADAQLAATTGEGAVAAFMNPGGVRADIDAGPVTYGESFAMQPFANTLVTMDITGANLRTMLKNQWCGQTGTSPNVLLPSSTVAYTFDTSIATSIFQQSCATAADPITSFTIDGAPVVDSQVYRITVNSFLADGGDRITALTTGTNRVPGVVDTVALEEYFAAAPGGSLDPPALDRISVVP